MSNPPGPAESTTLAPPPIYIIMGVSGAGKSTIGSLLAKQLQVPFYDADDFHTEENIAKLSIGDPLTDEDREPWLNKLIQLITESTLDKGCVLACSALRKSSRDRFREAAPHARFVYLSGNDNLIRQRLQTRSATGAHVITKYNEILKGQFRDLEPPSTALIVNAEKTPEEIVRQILSDAERRL